jgi:hypothetical protein
MTAAPFRINARLGDALAIGKRQSFCDSRSWRSGHLHYECESGQLVVLDVPFHNTGRDIGLTKAFDLDLQKGR